MVNVKTFRPAYKWERKPSRVVCVWCLLISGLFYLAAAINTAGAATYYLDAVNGNDSNPGTSAQPWKTLAKAQSSVTGGDTVIMRDGSYGAWNHLNSTDSDLYNDWVTYQSENLYGAEVNQITFENPSYAVNAYIIFDGLTVRTSYASNNIKTRNHSHLKFLNLDIIGDGYSLVEGLNSNRCIYIWGGTTDVEIDSCKIRGEGSALSGFGTGLYIAGVDLVITNNEITECHTGILVDGLTNGTITGNSIHNITSDGIIIGRVDTLLIENNEVYDLSLWYAELAETPNDTTWSEDGKTMTNANAQWNTSGDTLVTVGFEVFVNSGTNINTGDGNYSVAEVISDTEIRLSKSISNGGTPSNVDYTIRSVAHCDLMQANATTQSDNVTVRGNKFYNPHGQIVWLNPAIPPEYTEPGGHNWLIENNLFYNLYTSAVKEYGGTVLVGSMDGVVFRNNIVIGRFRCTAPSNNDITIKNNIISLSNWGTDNSHITEESYNIVNRADGSFFAFDDTTTFLGGAWDNATFYDIFADSNSGDFQHASGESLGVGHSDPANSPSTDMLGNIRDANPDAGCYESSPIDPNNPTPEFQVIGDKSVDENVTLIFTVNAIDPNGEPITYSAQGLPTGATLEPLTGEFAWMPSYQQASSYQVTFRASDGNSWDSETITITVNNVNRPPVLGAITDQSVDENALLSLSVNATDPDGQALTYSVSGLPAGAVFVSQTLTWTPSYDQAGTFPVTFTADDGQAQDSEAITITVINVNRTPVLTAINNQSVWADDPLTFTIDATDPDGDAVTYSAGNLPSDATFTGQDFDWTPSQGQMGSYNVTFIASDGQLQDSQLVTITVDVDSLAPTVTNSLPTAGSIQAPLNNLINLNITDAGKGIDADSVTIKVNNNTVYADDTNHYSSPDGECRRLGNKADYRFVYQSNEEFDYDQTVSITVNATDLAGNVMSENSYSFVTEMRSFGQNMMVNSGSVNLNSGRPVTVRDSSGNIWAAWHAGPIDNRDIYIGKLAAGEENFGGTVQLTDNTTDQCNPAVALDSSDKLYVVWQDNREGNWDIYVSTSVDGISWTTETRVNDPNDGDQVNPAIVIDGQSPNQAYVVWQDDRAGSQDICVATSSDGFVTTTVWQITSDISDQVEPAIAADSDNTIYIVWTDGRNGSNDIYGAASNNGLWNNVPVVTEDDGQSSPAIATEAVGSILHLVWVDDRLGDDDIYYDKTVAGLSPLTGRSIIDDTTGADQISPVIITTGYTGNDLKVFVCWRDERNADADLYFVEIGSDNETNVFVGDDGTSTDQSEPAIGIDGDDYPYLVWTNERTDIYYAGSTFVKPVALASTNVSVSSTATVGTVWNAVNSLDDVSAEVPQGAYLCDVKITISKIKNPPKSNLELDLFSGTYEFGPSGMEFIEPVTITIPYEVNGSENVLYTAYWYNPLTNTLSQQGITDVETIVISSTLHAVRFKTTHFSAFILGGGVAAALGGGGGGCSVSASGEGNIVEFILPYIGLAVVMVILKMRDARYRKARNT